MNSPIEAASLAVSDRQGIEMDYRPDAGHGSEGPVVCAEL